MRVDRTSWRADALTAALCLAALVLVALRFSHQLAPAAWIGAAIHPLSGNAAALVFHFSSLPRLAVAAMCGAALALSGAMFQHVLGNPLASPTLLGVSAGAQLALLAATVLAPAWLADQHEVVALVGAGLAIATAFGIAARQRFSSLGLILAGLLVGLFCGAVGGLLKLFHQEEIGAIFLWDGGSLAQQDWSVAAALWPRLLVFTLAAALVLRPMRLLGLADDSARGLGVSLAFFRTLCLTVAVCLAASVTAAVGVIGFVEIAAPFIARLAGARTLGHRMILSALIGAALLVLVDEAVQAFDRFGGISLPTGAVTALLAAPLLLLLLFRLKPEPEAAVAIGMSGRAKTSAIRVLLVLTVVVLAAIAFSTLVGRVGSGWSIASSVDWAALAPWRLPRTIEVVAAGAMLATAGALLQRSTGNPMASPEVLGIGAAVVAGLAVALVVSAAPSRMLLLIAGSAAAFALTAILIWRGSRTGFSPGHLVLTGLSLAAALQSIIAIALAANDPRSAILLGWMAGSSASADTASAGVTLLLAAILIPLALLFARSLDLLPLGDGVARSLGAAPGPARFGILALASVLTSASVLAVGPLTFVGLMGPHLALRLGCRRAITHLPGSALTGGLVMVLADWLGRVVIAPFEVPAGLAAALIGIPYLVITLLRRVPST
ncbi:Fe(3+)-hydroxamate ABC transporter permease FhuB [Lichenihabitans psoromatis]|uniref:Fe(3+)-hydroxamate ABC transporter permease FhuB n=1 Tax=Lichenihabitans psoromatis TaxID=2528642 RepID=UPI0010385CBC|nr:Fe(3+)-hydroxamate ABC transporter permease FhuB [Lichenihabitans psoromatis]